MIYDVTFFIPKLDFILAFGRACFYKDLVFIIAERYFMVY